MRLLPTSIAVFWKSFSRNICRLSLPNIACCVVIFLSAFEASANEAEKLYQTCVACHGQKGEGNTALKSPAIAGMQAWYIERQLAHFISGIRGSHPTDAQGQQMRAMVSQLNDKDVSALAAYVSNLSGEAAPEKVAGDLKNGSRYYQAKCGACHGGKAEGNESFKAPKLAGLQNTYLKRQMSNFVSGIRGKHPDDKLGKQMAMMAKVVSEKELNDILYYIAQQR